MSCLLRFLSNESDTGRKELSVSYPLLLNNMALLLPGFNIDLIDTLFSV